MRAVVRLSCLDSDLTEFIVTVMSVSGLMGTFLVIILTYVFILSTVLKIPSAEGKQKAFSTCASHLTVVIIHFGFASIIYLKPEASGGDDTVITVIAVPYTVVTPFLSPLIFSLRNKDMKNAFRKISDVQTMKINQTVLEEFILVGFSVYPHAQTFLLVVFFCLYLLTLTKNSTMKINQTILKEFILVGFSIYPHAQTFLFVVFFCLSLLILTACTECVLLAVMAYDRYLAICEPLRYPSLMPFSMATRLAASSWGSGFFSSMMKLLFISRLSYCGSNIINHFFCDISPLLNLTCSNKKQAELVDFLLALVMILLPLMAVVSSYAAIIATILRIPTAQGRHKAFSTCASHLAVVVIYYSSTLFTYARPQAMYTFNHNKVISVLYTVIVPFLNPAIYCLRNKEVKDALRKTVLGRCPYSRDIPD
ncbi:hypothetical protein MG293_001143 [Ovis ammon polii]|uniref:G-protein coupled receptors family 1 profile domain-containing protein n=1 Tax=Ovis ammon polii TaxID=230172 RepID=A0AAD4UM07_OVIAM|nr:hypothetical protein MG293_001143 [Ovis ammon polii]